MTKRFTTKNGVFYTDNLTGWEFQSYGEVVKLMNDLSDENEQLKSRVDYLGRKIERERNSTHKQYAKWEKEAEDKIKELSEENEQLKFKLEEVRSDEKQLSISFMEFKMKLIEKLQIHYDYATEQRQKNLDDIFVAKAYDIIRYDIKKLAEEMGVDLE